MNEINKRDDVEASPRAEAHAADDTGHSHYNERKPTADEEQSAPVEASSVKETSVSGNGEAVERARSLVRAQPPEDDTDARVHSPGKVAGGIPAVLSTLKHAWGEMGIVRGTRTLLRLNQKDGFDCPGCAWPDPDGHRSHVEFCENGAKHVADEATTKRVGPEFFRQWSVADLAQKSDYWLGKQGRLTHPMVLKQGATHYEPISWDEAFQLIAHELNALGSPDEAIFYTSGRTSNEAAFLYQLFVRQFGTNNLPDCSNMCHESSGSALTETIGIGKGTVTLRDFELADAIFIIGQNPGTNHPRMLTTLQQAARRGCAIVHINPLPETGLNRFKHPQEVLRVLGQGTELASLFLQVRINGDVALLKGIMKEVLAEETRRPGEVLDHKFIEEKTAGFAEFVRALESTGWDELIEQSGVSRELDARGGAGFYTLGARNRLLGDGADAAQERRREYSGDSQPPLAARADWARGRGRLSRARPLERAGRPHDGHLGTPYGIFS